MNFFYKYFKSFNNDQITADNNSVDTDVRSSLSLSSSSSSSASISSSHINSSTKKQFPNYIIINILNIIINQCFKDFIIIDYDYDIKVYSIINFLKLSLVSKNWDRFIIPHVKYPIIKVRFLKDIEIINKWISKGISNYPLVNMCEIEIDLPNQYASTLSINSEFKNLLRFKQDHIFEKLKLSTAIVQNDIETQVPSILIEFIIKYKVKELQLHNIPAIKNPMFKETIPILKYSLFQSVSSVCSIQHLTLKNQLLTCERVLNLMDLFPKLQTLDLTNNRIGIDYSECFTFAISKAICLTSLKIGSNVLKNNIKPILEVLKENCYQLKTLDISENYIQDDESSIAIEKFIEANKTIENLNLSGNLFNELGINRIVGSLPNNNNLGNLCLSNLNTFNASLLSDYLLSSQCKSLKHLNLSNIKFLSGELGIVFRALIESKFQSLLSLDLSYCKINDQEELNLLSTFLSGAPPTITTTGDIENNTKHYNNFENSFKLEKIKLLNVFIQSVPCKQLFSNLSNSITDLDLSLNCLYDSDCNGLAEVLKSNKSIKNLNLTRTKIRDIQPIFDCLKSNSTLKTLNLSGNSITLANVSLEFLLLNSTLTDLNISQNSIFNPEMENFFKHLVLNESITHLDIAMNKENGELTIPNFSKRKTKIFEINVSSFLKGNQTLLKACLRLLYGNQNFNTLSNIHDGDSLFVKEKLNMKRKGY